MTKDAVRLVIIAVLARWGLRLIADRIADEIMADLDRRGMTYA